MKLIGDLATWLGFTFAILVLCFTTGKQENDIKILSEKVQKLEEKINEKAH